MIGMGLVMHGVLFALLYALTDMQWYWAALVSGLIVWLGILIVEAGAFD